MGTQTPTEEFIRYREELERLFQLRKDLWAYALEHNEEELLHTLLEGEDAYIGTVLMMIRMSNTGDKSELCRLHDEWLWLWLGMESDLFVEYTLHKLMVLHNAAAKGD